MTWTSLSQCYNNLSAINLVFLPFPLPFLVESFSVVVPDSIEDWNLVHVVSFLIAGSSFFDDRYHRTLYYISIAHALLILLFIPLLFCSI